MTVLHSTLFHEHHNIFLACKQPGVLKGQFQNRMTIIGLQNNKRQSLIDEPYHAVAVAVGGGTALFR